MNASEPARSVSIPRALIAIRLDDGVVLCFDATTDQSQLVDLVETERENQAELSYELDAGRRRLRIRANATHAAGALDAARRRLAADAPLLDMSRRAG